MAILTFIRYASLVYIYIT